jgi:hypothetical protein
MAHEAAQGLAEALDPVILAERMSLAELLSNEERAALRDHDTLWAAARPSSEGPLAIGTVGGVVASTWHCFYGRGAQERADWERQCERHDPKGWAKRKAEIAAREQTDGHREADLQETLEKYRRAAAAVKPGEAPKSHAQTLAVIMFGAGGRAEKTDG